MSVDEIPRPAEVPSVEELLKRLDAACPRELLANETRRVIERARARMRRGETVEVGTIPAEILRSLATLERPSLRHVINATGIILHPRLGRAPLPPGIDGGYSNLDFDVTTGRKTRRDVHLRDLVERLTGYPGLPVNNNTAAMWLVLHELAGGGEVVVSRGELIDLGDGVRLPEIIARSGAAIREVGTANRTRIEDYQSAIGEHTKLILRVHASNFQLSGFSGRPDTAAISEVARKAELPLYSNLGSGSLIDLQPWGVREPVVADELENGAHLVSFSADKLTGGPQAGIITGDPGLINRLRRNPMLRALQCDKLTCAALETTLRSILFCRFEDVPALAMLSLTAEQVQRRAERLRDSLGRGEIIPGISNVGSRSTPAHPIPTWLLAMDGDADAMERQLRAADPAVLARIEDGRLVLDLRTVFEYEEPQLEAALQTLN